MPASQKRVNSFQLCHFAGPNKISWTVLLILIKERILEFQMFVNSQLKET